MNGVFVVSLRGGALLYHRAFARNFGLPVEGEPAAVDVGLDDDAARRVAPLIQCRCGYAHVDELGLGAMLYALHTYAADVVGDDSDALAAAAASADHLHDAAAAADDVDGAGSDASDRGDSDSGRARPPAPLEMVDLGPSRLHFWRHPDPELALLAVVSTSPAMADGTAASIVRRIGESFASKFDSRLRVAMPVARFSSFKSAVRLAVADHVVTSVASALSHLDAFRAPGTLPVTRLADTADSRGPARWCILIDRHSIVLHEVEAAVAAASGAGRSGGGVDSTDRGGGHDISTSASTGRTATTSGGRPARAAPADSRSRAAQPARTAHVPQSPDGPPQRRRRWWRGIGTIGARILRRRTGTTDRSHPSGSTSTATGAPRGGADGPLSTAVRPCAEWRRAVVAAAGPSRADKSASGGASMALTYDAPLDDVRDVVVEALSLLRSGGLDDDDIAAGAAVAAGGGDTAEATALRFGVTTLDQAPQASQGPTLPKELKVAKDTASSPIAVCVGWSSAADAVVMFPIGSAPDAGAHDAASSPGVADARLNDVGRLIGTAQRDVVTAALLAHNLWGGM